MDINDNKYHPSRITRTAVRPSGGRFGYQDWRGGVHHECHANCVDVLQPEQISILLCSNPIQWPDYSLIKKHISFTQIEIYNMEQSAESFERAIAYD